MYAECRHVFASGRKCTHPQLHDSHFCYFHRNAHEIMHAPAPRPGTPFRLPLLEDSSALLMAIQQVTSSLGAKTITQKEAGTYLYAINIAKVLLPRRPAMTRKPVRSLCYDNDGFEMAEPVNTCEPPRDCLDCQKTRTCAWFEYFEDEVEELEQQMDEEEEEKRRAAQQAENPDADPSADDAKQTPAEKPKPWAGKYDHERPQVRALFEILEAEDYAKIQAMEKLNAEKQSA